MRREVTIQASFNYTVVFSRFIAWRNVYERIESCFAGALEIFNVSDGIHIQKVMRTEVPEYKFILDN